MSTPSDYVWSEWSWDPERGKYYRYRWNSKNKQVWESREAQSTPRVPEPSTSTSVARFSSSTADENPQYFNDYQYGQAQASDPVAGLAEGIARTTLSPRTGAGTDYTGYNAGPSSPGYQVAAQYQAAQPTAIPGAYGQRTTTLTERSMYSAADRMSNYRMSSSSRNYSSSSNYNIPSSSSGYYDTTLADEEEEDDNGDDDPYDGGSQRNRGSRGQSSSLGRSYGSEVTVTQANSRSRDPPPPLQTSMELTDYPEGDPRRRIRGTRGSVEPLNEHFRVHRSRHFKPGHIFKVVWTEPRGETFSDAASTSGRTDVTDVTTEDISPRTRGGAFQSPIQSGVRRFVIVATGNGFSNCVPILTYGRQGLLKPGITKRYHAIIYSTAQPPTLSYTPDCVPIQFQGKNAQHKLNEYSLINYAKIYAVEHNVKVQFIGWIAESSQRPFVADFDIVWQSLNHIPG